MPNSNLSKEEIEQIRDMIKALAQIARSAKQPIDPKVEAMIDITISLLTEQIELDKRYEWAPPATEDDRFLDTSDTDSAMSVEELKRLMEGDINE